MSDVVSQIAEHMEVVGDDGEHVGTVDKVEGDRIKLTKKDDPDGSGQHHHYLSLDAVASVSGGQVRLSVAAEQAKQAAIGGAAGGGGSADAVYNQGIILWNQGKIAEAKVKFEEALVANPNHPESNFQLGMALLNEGKVPEAIAAFEKYLTLAPTGQFAEQAKGMLAQLKK